MKFVCENCPDPRQFVDFISYKNHFDEEHPVKGTGKGYLCDLCPINLQVYTKALNHLTNHQPYLKHCCLICSKFYWNFKALKEHLKTEHPEDSKPLHICEYCGHYSTQASHRTHILYFHLEVPRKAISKIAGLPRVQVENPNFLNIGLEYKNVDGSVSEQGLNLVSKKRYMCDFIIPDFLNSLIFCFIFRWSDVAISCNLCRKQYENIFQLHQHAKDRHSKDKSAKAYKCTDCKTPKEFLTHTRFVRHVGEFHHKILKYCCLGCPKIFWNFQAINRHYQLDHQSEQVFICLTCGHYSLTNLDLKRHRKKHGTLRSRKEGYYYRGKKTQVVAQVVNI